MDGELTRVKVDSRKRWVRTGVQLRAGCTYRLTADGVWTDLAMTCGPEGYASRDYPHKLASLFLRLMEWTRRVRQAHWFALVGVVDSDRRRKFVIGRAASVTPRRDGELLCFANDFWLAYVNNSGSVDLKVERVHH